jgi:ankyrin repeat protein
MCDCTNTPPPLTEEQIAAWRCFDRVQAVMISGNESALNDLALELDSFPHGVDPALDRHWLTNAIDGLAPAAVAWMVALGVDLSYVDDEGFTPLMSALQIDDPEIRLSILRLLLVAGSRHDLVGTNCWTAAHFAASCGFVDELKLLEEFGADLCASTEDLGSWSTPLIVARRQGHAAVAEYLEKACGGVENRRYQPNV